MTRKWVSTFSLRQMVGGILLLWCSKAVMLLG